MSRLPTFFGTLTLGPAAPCRTRHGELRHGESRPLSPQPITAIAHSVRQEDAFRCTLHLEPRASRADSQRKGADGSEHARGVATHSHNLAPIEHSLAIRNRESRRVDDVPPSPSLSGDPPPFRRTVGRVT
jgi:hypothetical protein